MLVYCNNPISLCVPAPGNKNCNMSNRIIFERLQTLVELSSLRLLLNQLLAIPHRFIILMQILHIENCYSIIKTDLSQV